MEDAGWSLIEMPVQEEIKIYMRKAVEHFARNGLTTSKVGPLSQVPYKVLFLNKI